MVQTCSLLAFGMAFLALALREGDAGAEGGVGF